MKALIGLAIAAVLALTGFVLVATGVAPVPFVELRTDQVAAAISGRLTEAVGERVAVRCDDAPLQKGRISDCVARLGDRRTGVRVTQDDYRGHYHYEVEEPLALASDLLEELQAELGALAEAPPVDPPDAATPAVPFPSPLDEPEGECSRAPDEVLAAIASKPRGNAGPLVLPSGYMVEGERGYVVGGFLSSADASGSVDGAYGTWFVSHDATIYAYTDAALGLTNWPQTGDGSETARTRTVRECAESNAG